MIYILGLIAGLVHKCEGCQKSHCCSLAAAPEPSQLRGQGGAHRNTGGKSPPQPALGHGQGKRHPKAPSHHLEKGIDYHEQDLLRGKGQHENGLGLQRSLGEAPSILLFL